MNTVIIALGLFGLKVTASILTEIADCVEKSE
jgi:hypothetical protein